MSNKLLVTKKEAAEMLSMSVSMFNRLEIMSIKFGDSKQSGKRYRICDIKKFIEKQLKKNLQIYDEKNII